MMARLEERNRTFFDLLQSEAEMDCEIIVGNCDMPATFVWGEDFFVSDYGYEKFKTLLDAKFNILPNGNIEILCNDWKLGEAFIQASAGYISQKEYDKIFKQRKEGLTW